MAENESAIERIAIQATVAIAIDIERHESGLWFASSPMVKGLTIAGHSRDELIARIPGIISDLTAANMEPETVALQRVAGKIRFRERRIAQFTETARLNRLEGRDDLATKTEATIEEDRRVLDRLRATIPARSPT